MFNTATINSINTTTPPTIGLAIIEEDHNSFNFRYILKHTDS